MSVRTPDPDPEDSDDDLARFSEAASDASNPGWLTEFELADARRRLPMLYVEAIPVRTDGVGQVTEVGMLLRSTPMGEMRDALFRHVENDLGPMAFPLLPLHSTPFTVAEYFPMPGLSAFHDDRQHAVSLAFVVPVTGTCEPRQDALEVTWFSPEAAASDAEMEGGRGTLIRQALASLGLLR